MSDICSFWQARASVQKVLTLCQSGKWNTLGGRGRLNPCALCHHAVKRKEKKNVAGDVCSFLVFMNCTPHWTICHFLFIPPPNCVPHPRPLRHTLRPPLIVPVSLSLCHLHFSPTDPGCWQPLKSWLVVTVAGYVWQGSPSKAGPHEYSATPLEWPSP